MDPGAGDIPGGDVLVRDARRALDGLSTGRGQRRGELRRAGQRLVHHTVTLGQPEQRVQLSGAGPGVQLEAQPERAAPRRPRCGAGLARSRPRLRPAQEEAEVRSWNSRSVSAPGETPSSSRKAFTQIMY